jgi:hypothetical protein
MTVKYQLTEHPNSFHDKHWSIVIDEGEYQGVTYQYDTVSFNEEENGDIVLSFNTITLENPNKLDLYSEEFESIMGNVLTDLIEKHLEEADKNEDGTGDTEAPTE